MRVVFVGAGSITRRTAKILLERRHEVIVIERDEERIESLRDDLDCAFLHGDGSRPALLREADPEGTDVLLCMTADDQTNIIASLVGRSLGFERIVTRVEAEEFEHICIELGLEHTVIPARTSGRYLADMVEGQDILEVSAAIKGDARVYLFVAREEDAGPASELGLPSEARAVHLYRDGRFRLIEADTRLEKGDEVVVITHRKNLGKLRERWSNQGATG